MGISGKRAFSVQLFSWFCVVSFSGGERRAQQLGALTCLNNYITTIHCSWTTTVPTQDRVHQLLFTSNLEPHENYSCILQMGTCTLELPPDKVLTVFDEFTINFHGSVSGVDLVYLLDPKYLPRQNIKLDPPSNLQSNVSSRGCIISWNPPIEELYRSLSYELALRQPGEAWERARHKDHIVGVTKATIEAFEFSPGLTYEARLRCRLGSQEIGEPLGEEEEDFRYRSQWSEWSPILQFRSPNSLGVSSPPQEGPINTIIVFSILLFLISLPYILFKLFPRVKKIFYQNVPSPEAFFRPLYTVHNGNFQESISHLTCFPMKPKTSDVIEEENPYKPKGPPEEATQQDPESKYLSVEELETWRLPGVVIDRHGDSVDIQGHPDFPGANQVSSLAMRCLPISLKEEGQTLESCIPSNSDYCTLSGSEMPQALAPTGEPQGPKPSIGQ